jgi:polyferredoxin
VGNYTGEEIIMNGEILRFCLLGITLLWFIVAGRLFCGKICPLGYLQDLIYKIPFPVKIKTFKGDKYLRLIKYIYLISQIVIIILTIFGIFRATEQSVAAISPIMKVVIAIILFVFFIIVRRPFCKYFCLVGATSSLFNKISFYKYKMMDDKCIKCGACSKICKMNIVPYTMNNSLECIRCGLCKKICPKNAIISGFNEKKLPM